MSVQRGRLGVVDPDRAGEIVSPPFDAIPADERARWAASRPDSYLAVTDDRIVDDPEAEVARQAAARLRRAGTYTFTDECLFAYELERGEHRQLGVVGTVPVGEPGGTRLLTHEDARPDGVERLVRFRESTGLEGSPVVLGHRPDPVVAAVLRRAADGPPLVEVDQGFGTVHRAWPICDPDQVAAVERALVDTDCYVVDGHHRTAAAEALARHHPDRRVGLLAALFPLDALDSLGYHRVIASRATERSVHAHFEIRPIAGPEVDVFRSELVVRLERAWWAVEVGELPVATSSPLDWLDPVRADTLLGPVLGYVPGDPRLRYLAGPPTPDDVAEADAAGEAVVICRPVTGDDLVRVADAGLRMPPKSSFFVPKVAEGLFLTIT